MAFSEKIQSLISSSGQDSAMTRAAQLKAHVAQLERQLYPEEVQKTEGQTFAQLLKSSTPNKASFGLPKNLSVNAKTNISTLYPTISNPSNVSRGQIMNIISSVAKKYDMDEKLIHAVIKQESGYNPQAVSHCGAMGLMQLMPATAKKLGVTDAMNPIQNIDAGTRHLKGLMARYRGNLVLALAAYNAGGGNVDKYNGVPPFKETQQYVKNILANYLG